MRLRLGKLKSPSLQIRQHERDKVSLFHGSIPGADRSRHGNNPDTHRKEEMAIPVEIRVGLHKFHEGKMTLSDGTRGQAQASHRQQGFQFFEKHKMLYECHRMEYQSAFCDLRCNKFVLFHDA